ncbi:hypothetical protein [Photobacterium kishitanii]|uniref:hypothetical protein n=1 Tax=Photobacterium kishitanii TaxID=318456 RepID=UPI0027394145|nr:hypothetical protein [Photobacterium kishitanii]
MSNQHNDVQPLSSFMNHLSLMTKATIRDYDEILMNELVSNKLDLITEPVLDLCTNVNVYQQWKWLEKKQLI